MKKDLIKIDSRGKLSIKGPFSNMSLKDALKTLVEYAKKLEEIKSKNE